MVSGCGIGAASARSVVGLNLLFDFVLDFVDPFFVENAFAQQKHLQARNRIARGIGLALGSRDGKAARHRRANANKDG